MNNVTPITQRKAITMDYEEYLKLEERSKMFFDVVIDIANANTLDDIKPKYLKFLDEVNKEFLV